MLPGIAVALALDPGLWHGLSWWRVLVGLTAVGLVSSSNYVLNELLDAPFDRLHPRKRNRPVAAGHVIVRLAWAQWPALFAAGLAAGALVSRALAYDLAALWVMGILYNVPPIRLKDIAWVDVLSEAVNNPIRFLAGWHLTGTRALPITSLLVTYWMAGCYFMAIKRYAEMRDMPTAGACRAYRKSYRHYTPDRLLVSVIFYGALAMLFFGEYMGRYRLEMVVAFPFVAIVMAMYFALVFKSDGAAGRPELLARQGPLVAAVCVCALAMALMLFVDLPWLYEVFGRSGAAAGGAG